MWWSDAKWWKGTVLSIKRRIIHMEPETESEDSDDEDNLTLASLVHSELDDQRKNEESLAEPAFESLMNPDESTLAAAAEALNSSGVFTEIIACENEQKQDNDDNQFQLLNVPSAEDRIDIIKRSVSYRFLNGLCVLMS